jgi:hypothetical protein
MTSGNSAPSTLVRAIKTWQVNLVEAILDRLLVTRKFSRSGLLRNHCIGLRATPCSERDREEIDGPAGTVELVKRIVRISPQGTRPILPSP